MRSEPAEDWWPNDGLILHLPLDGNTANRCEVAQAATTNNGDLVFHTGQIGEAAEFSGKQVVNIGDVANFGYFDRFSIGLWIQPRNLDGVVLGRMAEVADAEGYNIQLDGGKLQLNLVKRWLDESIAR